MAGTTLVQENDDHSEWLRNNPNHTSLQLSGNNIADAEAKQLASMLCSDTQLTELNLSGNNISSAGATAWADALRRNITLTRLNLSQNNIGYSGATKLAQILPANVGLKKLHMNGRRICATDGVPAQHQAHRAVRECACRHCPKGVVRPCGIFMIQKPKQVAEEAHARFSAAAVIVRVCEFNQKHSTNQMYMYKRLYV